MQIVGEHLNPIIHNIKRFRICLYVEVTFGQDVISIRIVDLSFNSFLGALCRKLDIALAIICLSLLNKALELLLGNIVDYAVLVRFLQSLVVLLPLYIFYKVAIAIIDSAQHLVDEH